MEEIIKHPSTHGLQKKNKVNLKKDMVVRVIQSTKHQTRKEKHMLSLQQGKSAANYLDKLDTGKVTGASGGALQSPKRFGSRTSGLVKRQGFGGLSLFPGG